MAKRVSTDNRKLTAKDILATQSASDRIGAKPFSEIDVTPAAKDIDSLQKQVAEMTPSQPSQEVLIDTPMQQTTLWEVIGDKPVQESTSMFGRARDNLQKDIQDLKKQRIDEAKKDIASQDQATQQLYQETRNKEHTKDMEELDSILKESERIQKDIDAGVSVTETDKALERLNKRKARLLDANARETDVIKRFRRNVEIKKITDAFDGLEKLKNIVKGKEGLSSAFWTVGKLFQRGTYLIDEWSEKKKETKETANVALETKTWLWELRGDIANIDWTSEIAKLQDTKWGKKLDLNTLRFMKSLTWKLRNDIFQNIFLHNYIIEILRNPSSLSNWQDILRSEERRCRERV